MKIFYIQTMDSPGFIGMKNYFRMLGNDPLLSQALLNTFIKPLVAAFGAGIIIFLIKSIFFVKTNSKWKQPLYYTCMFIVSSVAFYITVILKTILGVPQESYSTAMIMQHISDYRMTRIMDLHVNIPLILATLLIGVLICFAFWVIEKAVRKIRSSVKKV